MELTVTLDFINLGKLMTISQRQAHAIQTDRQTHTQHTMHAHTSTHTTDDENCSGIANCLVADYARLMADLQQSLQKPVTI